MKDEKTIIKRYQKFIEKSVENSQVLSLEDENGFANEGEPNIELGLLENP